MSDAPACGRLTDVGRAVLRKAQSDLRMQELRNKKLSLKLRRARAVHKAEIELLQAQLDAARYQAAYSKPEAVECGNQTESTDFRHNQSTQVETGRAAEFCAYYCSIYDEISRTLPDFSQHTHYPMQNAPSSTEETKETKGEQNDVYKAIYDLEFELEIGDRGILEQRALRKVGMQPQSERQVEQISLLHCKRVSSVIEGGQASHSERNYAGDRRAPANEPSSASEDYFIRSIEEAAQREQYAARTAVIRPAPMQYSLWQRLTDSGQLHVSRGKIGAGQ